MTAQIIEELQALQAHYPRQARATDEEQRWLRDYVEDLHACPDDAVRYACRRWRQSGARKYPTSGELLSFAQQFQPRGDANETRKTPPWGPVSDYEYDAMTLAEKLRHQTILGNHAQFTAGPQTKPKEAMPEAWHEHRERARHHFAEASRLRGLLAQARQREAFAR